MSIDRMLSRRIIFGALGLLLTAGCASGPTAKERYYWPRLPDTPRLEWLAAYSGEADLRADTLLSKIIEVEAPRQLAMPNYLVSDGEGKIYVADSKREGVFIFDLNKRKVQILGEGSLEKPVKASGIALDKDGNIYAADTAQMAVFVYDRDYHHLKKLELGGKVISIGSMAIDKVNGRLIVPDIKGHKIVVFDLNGALLKSFGERGDADGNFNYPTAVAVEKDGNFLVCDSQNARIQRFSPDGTFLFKFGKRGDNPGEFAVIKAVAVDSEGHIYVSDGKLNTINIFGPKGEFLMSFGGSYAYDGTLVMPAGFLIPQGIAIDKNDTIYIADQMNGRIQVFQYLNEKYLKVHPLSEGVPALEVGQKKSPKGK